MSLYLRESQRLAEAGITSVSSTELGRFLDVSPAVVRKDLAAIGAVGRRGLGYPIAALMERIGATLGAEIHWNVILVGAGLLLGVVESLGGYLIDPALTIAINFALFMLVLLLRPTGLFTRA